MYYVVYGILYLFSLLPLKVLYILSDFAYFLVYRVFRYRIDIVKENIRLSFPEKTEEEVNVITRRFYRNFTDHFIEFIKQISASEAFIRKHFTGDYSICNEIYRQGKKCELLLAHNFNWEWFNLAVPLHTEHEFLGVYMPIKNRIFERIFLKARSKTGSRMLPATNMRSAIIPFRSTLNMLVLVADQNAGSAAHANWVHFFGRPAPFVRGPEKAARAGDIPVLFCKIVKVKRGYYHATIEMGEEHPARLKPGELTKKYVSYLETVIREQPENWLWSHRRWKHKWKAEYGPVLDASEVA